MGKGYVRPSRMPASSSTTAGACDGLCGTSAVGRERTAQVLDAVRAVALEHPDASDAFSRELVWREFAHHLLVHFPHTPEQPLDKRFQRFAWQNTDPSVLRA